MPGKLENKWRRVVEELLSRSSPAQVSAVFDAAEVTRELSLSLADGSNFCVATTPSTFFSRPFIYLTRMMPSSDMRRRGSTFHLAVVIKVLEMALMALMAVACLSIQGEYLQQLGERSDRNQGRASPVTDGIGQLLHQSQGRSGRGKVPALALVGCEQVQGMDAPWV